METEADKPFTDVWARCRSIQENRQSMFYRYEGEGVVVYDVNARIFDEPSVCCQKLQQNVVGLKQKVEVIDAEEYGKGYLDLSQYLNMKKYPPVKTFNQEYTLVIPEDSLRFDSRFESGNLKKAIRVREREYDLLLDYDVETRGYTQWFYFAVTGCKAPSHVRFNIVNLMKYESLYNDGMKPLVFSMKQPEKGWHRECSAISYFKNLTPRPIRGPGCYFYTLTFTYSFKHSEDKVFFAYSYPYTHTDLRSYLDSISLSNKEILRVNTLCHSLAGVPCPVLTITHNISSYPSWDIECQKLKKSAAGRRFIRMRELKAKNSVKKPDEHELKKCIVLTSRVHPGESNGSYMMKGAIDFLTSDTKEARILRKRFVFKIIPMLNPDGVIYGNYRCSLLGVDLNRRWRRPNRILHPEIYYSKRLIQMMAEEREVMLYCDMHGHSIKKDVFMYGCRDNENKKQDVFIRIIPYLLSKKNQMFAYKQCVFRVNKDKLSTSRVVCFKDIGILASYTMEASFYGPSHKAALENRMPLIGELNGDSHMEIIHLESIGRDFCIQLLTLINTKEFNKNLRMISSSLSLSNFSKAAELQNFVSGETELEETSNNCNIKDMIDCIDESTLNELYNSGQDLSSGDSDSEGSDNDDKRINFKNQKLFKSAKQNRRKKSMNEIESYQQKRMRKSISGRTSTVSPRNEILAQNHYKKTSQNATSKEQAVYRLLNRTPDIDIRSPLLQKTQNSSNGFKQVLKFAAAVKLPKESTLFKPATHQKLRSLQERRPKFDQTRDKSDLLRTKVKFKEVMISMADSFQHRKTYTDFFK